MYTSSMRLVNFRNIDDTFVRFSPGINVIFGENGQGKTNLLEGLCFLATGRSHRTNQNQDLIQDGASSFLLRATVSKRSQEVSLEFELSSDNRKKIKINNTPEKKATHLVGNLVVVFFSPEDLQLVKGAPAGRRRFIDIELSQIYKSYLSNLIDYNRIVLNKNALLKEKYIDHDLLSIYNEQLSSLGAELIIRRKKALDRLAPIATQYHRVISEGKEELRIEYRTLGKVGDINTDLEHVSNQLRQAFIHLRSDEIRRQQTLVGPHRDDLIFLLDGRDAQIYGSQGQQRTIVLSTKLAEVQFIYEEIGEYPVLILDDVMSELDVKRKNLLVLSIKNGVQTFISCTDINSVALSDWSFDHTLFEMHRGSVKILGRDEM